MKRMSNEETLERIRLAVLSCLKENRSVTMEEVAVRAGISRRTLYRYYEDRKTLLDSLRVSWLQDYRRELRSLMPLDTYKVGLAMFRVFTNHREEVQAFRRNGRMQDLFRGVQEDMPALNQEFHPDKMSRFPPHYLKYDEAYNSGAFIALLDTWLEDEPLRSPEEMAAIYTEIMRYC